MSAATIEMLERAADALAPLGEDEVAFVGGATIALWATDPAAAEFRPTDDVDVIVGVTSRVAYYRFEERLKEVGFVNDEKTDSPVASAIPAGTWSLMRCRPTRRSSASRATGRRRRSRAPCTSSSRPAA